MGKKQFVCLSGLPRSGSTLLSAILDQNPNIHAEGNSAVCQLMADVYISCTTPGKSIEQLMANNRDQTVHDLVSGIRGIYYKNVKKPIIVDKCRSWTLEGNFQMSKLFIDPNIKMIVLERSVTEIVKSFGKLYKKNNNNRLTVERLLAPMSEPLMRSIAGLEWAKKHNEHNNFLFITYNELINDTKSTIDKIYAFCGWEPFAHDFTNITNNHPENDEVYGLHGQHTIRAKVEKLENNIKLPEEVYKKCITIDKLLGYIK
jgi:sulfotransferase